jgi:drug/metabolite transporter (DMT)-like permease
MSKLIDNERAKLSATFYNNVGIACFAGGAILPVMALIGTKPAPIGHALLILTLGFVLGSGSHLFALWQLRKLQE